ncbi:MAG TPA: CHAT domain-containing tetratricopeptide repeat protein [Acidobacteriota bacterium]|nr:CHAT domain-containing tetratricopeptide repeat protein [Acidobacteriota bacterium]
MRVWVFVCLFALLGFNSLLFAEEKPAADIVKDAESEVTKFNFDAAIAKFEKAIALYQSSGDKQGEADTYLKLGTAYSRVAKYTEALRVLELALKLHQELQIKKSIGDDFTAIARAHSRQGDYEKSLATSAKAIEIHQEFGDKKGLADTYRIDAVSFDFMGDYKKSLELAERCLSLYTELNDTSGVAASYSIQGASYWKMGDLDVAAEKFQKAIDLIGENGDASALCNYHGNLGLVYWNKGDMPLAMKHTYKSLEKAKISGNKGSEATTYFNLGLMFMEQGRLQEAQANLQDSLTMAEEHDDKGLIAVCLEGLGKLQKFYGDYERALDYYKKSYIKAKEIGEKRAEAYAVAAMGYVYEHDGKHAMAIDSFQTAYRLYEQMDEKRGIAKMHESIGQVRLDMKKYDEALKDFHASLSILESIGAKYEMPETYRALGIAYQKKNQLDEADKALSKSIEMAREIELANTLWPALHQKGLVLRELGHSDEALQLLTEAIDVVEKMRTQLENIDQRAAYLEERLGVYEDTIQLLVASDKIPEAFEYVQRSKARAFLDMLAEGEIASEGILDPILRERRTKILADLMKSEKNLQDEKNRDNPNAAKIDQIRKTQTELDHQYEDLIVEIRNTNPMYAEVQYPQPLKLAQAQALLDDDTVLLEYFLGSTGSSLFVVSKNDVAVFPLKNGEELSRLVTDFRKVIMKPDPIYDASEKTYSKYANLAATLYADTLKPAESFFNSKTKVLIAPDGALSYLPFESLLTHAVNVNKIDFAKLPYFARGYEVDYVPSISVFASIAKNKHQTPDEQMQLLAFADPALKDAAQPGKSRNVRSWAGTLTQLPHARDEVNGISQFYPKNEVTVVIGNDASESKLKQMKLDSYKRLHFASHGLIDEEKPEFSALVLTAGNESEDGFLTMREVFDLKLNADLVVLSACKSGLGKEIRGEGITGISRAFLCAGTPSVLVSLWDVYDRSTADLMTSFYKNMETKNLSKAAALRAARLEMMQNPKYSHPYYWAPFILIGQR